MNELRKILDEFSPDYAYVHNTWFKGSLGIFEVLKEKNGWRTLVLIEYKIS